MDNILSPEFLYCPARPSKHPNDPLADRSYLAGKMGICVCIEGGDAEQQLDKQLANFRAAFMAKLEEVAADVSS